MKMRNTNTLTFTLRERAYLSTKIFKPEDITAGQEPGQTLLVSVDPIGALLSAGIDTTAQGKDVRAQAPYATTLAVTLSRFRRFRYIGTRVGLRPAATTGEVDIAHISQPAGGSSNYVHPYDVSNMIHYRRWIGGAIDLPHIRVGKHINPATGQESLYWDVKQAMDLDLAWMSDPRFMHSNVSQGFDLFARPMRATVEAAPEGATTMWLYGNGGNAGSGGTFAPNVDADKRPKGRAMLTGGRIVPDGWTHNPLSCFRYTSNYGLAQGGHEPAHEVYKVSGVNELAPWFADYYDVDGFPGTVDQVLQMVRERYMNPVCILRLPPAYGTVMYYTMYLAHYFAVKEPYLVNTAYVAARIQNITPHPVSAENDLLEMPRMHLEDSGIVIHQAVCPDPQSAAETGYTAEFAALHDMQYAPALRMRGTDEPTDGMDEMQDAFAEFGEEPPTEQEPILPPKAVEPPEGGGVSGGDEERQNE